MRTARTLVALIAAGASVCTPHAYAISSDIWLNEAEISKALEGKTLDGVYAGGRRFSESYMQGGNLEYRENGETLRGHWSITQGTLCTIYDANPTGGCFRVAPAGGNCFEFYFVARTEEAAAGSLDERPDWTARGSVEGTLEACPDGANV